MEVRLYEKSERLGGPLGNYVFSRQDRTLQVERGETYYFLPYHRKIQALLDYLNIYTEPRATSYLYYDYYAAQSLLFSNPSFNRFSPFVNGRITRNLNRFLHKTLHSCIQGDYPTNLMLKQYIAGLNIQSQEANEILPSLIGLLWHHSREEALSASAETCIRFFDTNGMLQTNRINTIRFLPQGFEGYINKMLFKGRFSHHLNHPIRTVRREENSISVKSESGESAKYDQVILACSADKALSLLDPISDDERNTLENIQYASSPVFLHQDSDFIPRQPQREAPLFILQPYPIKRGTDCAYHINLGLMQEQDISLYLSAQCAKPPEKEKILLEGIWRKPKNTRTVFQAIQNLEALQGQGGVWFCGSHTYNDTSPMTIGIDAALDLAEKMKLKLPFN